MQTHHAFYDLREFIDFLEKKGDLVRVREEVDPELEINAIIDRLIREDGPAVLFENVKGHDMPVLGNLFGSYRRLSDTFGTDDFTSFMDGLSERLIELTKSNTKEMIIQARGKGLKAKLRTIFSLPKLLLKIWETKKMLNPLLPVEIPRAQAPCKEVVLSGQEVDLTKFPFVKLWPQDGGKFNTLPLIITRDPETRELNVGIYRMMLLDKNRFCMHWLPQKHGNMHHKKYEAENREMPVVVVIGADPVLELAGTFMLTPPIDEFMVAGLLKNRPLEYVKAEDSDLWVPASAEIVLEGVIKPHERTIEGPFGEFHGYYSPTKETPVFHVRKITMRNKPILHVATTGMPPAEIHFFAKAAERFCLAMLKPLMPGVVDINFSRECGAYYTLIISFKKSRPYEVHELLYFLWSFSPQGIYISNIIVVDPDVDIHNLKKVFWAVSVHFRPDKDLLITPVGMADLEKPSTYPRGSGSRMGIDATTKAKEEGHVADVPELVNMDMDIRNMIESRWSAYGLK